MKKLLFSLIVITTLSSCGKGGLCGCGKESIIGDSTIDSTAIKQDSTSNDFQQKLDSIATSK